MNYWPISIPPVWSTCFFISTWKFGIRLGYVYYKNILKLNLCFPYAYINLNIKYDIKDSYSWILYYFNTFSFSFFFHENFVHNWKHYIQQEKNPFLTTILLFSWLAVFGELTDRLDLIFEWLNYIKLIPKK